jgi:hypothetical protein
MRRGLRRWAKPLRFSHICVNLILLKKGGLFSDSLPPFSIINIGIFFEKVTFLKGKPPFIFNQDKFIADHAATLQVSIATALDPVKLSAIARQNGFLQRKSKLKPEEFVDMLMFSSFDHSQLSLQECCNDLAQQHQTSLSKVGLHKRFNPESLKFLKAVLAEQIASKMNLPLSADKWAPFSAVKVSDSCKFTLPLCYNDDYPGYKSFGQVSSIMNIQYAFDLKHGDWENLEFTKATQNDQSHSNNTLDRVNKGELHIRDLGFVTMIYLAKVVSEKAYFLNRLNPQWKPIENSTGKKIDWTSLYQKMKSNKAGHFETRVTIGKDERAFGCRLIAVAVPEQVYEERIRTAQQKMKSMGSELSDEYKARCRFSIFITNTDEETLKAADVIQLYRLRWQIELVFKNWKSLLGIHKIKAVKKDRLECQLIARFIWILLNWKIFQCVDTFIQKQSKDYACSMWKFFKQARHYGHTVRKVIAGNMNFSDWCEIFLCPIIKGLLIEPKKGKKAGFMIVNAIFAS